MKRVDTNVAFPFARDSKGNRTPACEAIRGESYRCLICDDSMTPVTGYERKTGEKLEQGMGPRVVSRIAPHFRHCKGSCLHSYKEKERISQWSSAGETRKHALMKEQIATALRCYAMRLELGREANWEASTVRMLFVCALRICALPTAPAIDFPVEFDDAKIESKIPGTNRIGDVVTLLKGQVTSVIEVCASHPVSREKRDELNATGIPWFEVNAKHFDPRTPSVLRVTQSNRGPMFCGFHQKEKARFEARAPERVRARERARRRTSLLAHLESLRPKPKLARVIPITRSQAAQSNNAPSSHVEQWHAITKHEHQIWDCLPGGGHTLYKISRLA